MLRIVLVDLVANAIKFTRQRAQAEIEIGRAEGSDHEAVVFIRGNGQVSIIEATGHLLIHAATAVGDPPSTPAVDQQLTVG